MPYSSAYATGLLLALMVFFNSLLASVTSIYVGSFFFNFIGFLFFSLCLILGVNVPARGKKSPYHLIVPGILGALTIVLSNLTVAEIGVALMVGISLLGQMITSLFIDGFGLLGKEKTPITVKQLISLFIIAIGVYFLL